MPIATLAATPPQTPAQWVLIAAIAALILGFVVVRWLTERSRRREITELLGGLGFQIDAKPRAFDPDSFGFLLANPLLRYTGNTVCWSAAGVVAGRTVRVVEYRFVTGSGRSRSSHNCLVGAVDLPVALPEFTLERDRWLTTVGPAMPARTIAFDDPAFSKAFRFYASSNDGAVTLITPPVQRVLMELDKEWWLRFSDGALLLGCGQNAGAGNLRKLLDVLDRLMTAIVLGSPR